MPPELSGHPEGYILLTSLLRAFVGELFPGLEMLGCYQWRVTRNSDLFVDEEEVTNLRHALQGELSQRNFGAAVRLEIDKMTPPELETFLQREFSLKPEDTYRVPGPVNLSRLMQLCNANTRPELLFPTTARRCRRRSTASATSPPSCSRRWPSRTGCCTIRTSRSSPSSIS